MLPALIPPEIRDKFDIREWRHASSILTTDFPRQWKDIIETLSNFKLSKVDITTPGGRKSPIADKLDKEFYRRGWEEKLFDTRVIIDHQERENPTHKIDCYKDGVALEIEWNNKDPFYDRDLNNFRILFELQAVSVGIIITRCDELQRIFDSLGKGASYGPSTTHMGKLLPRIEGGGAGGCPIIVFGISRRLYYENI